MSEDKEKKPGCEFCGKKRKTAATLFFGPYCIECLETVIEHCRVAIKEIKALKG